MWAYLSVLSECIKILLTVGAGFTLSACSVFSAKTFVPQAVKFVFRVSLPLLVLRGIGIHVDFYSKQFLWIYIVAFLILRALALMGSIAWVSILSSLGKQNAPGIGDVAVVWLSLTWISTVVMGIPILTSVFGDPTKGMFYGLLAGISSFIFQLPLQLFFFEYHSLRRGENNSCLDSSSAISSSNPDNIPCSVEAPREKPAVLIDSGNNSSDKGPHNNCADPCTPQNLKPSAEAGLVADEESGKEPKIGHSTHENENCNNAISWVDVSGRSDLWKGICIRIVKNPVLWGIAGGFFLSLSTLGPRYLRPSSDNFIPGLRWIDSTLRWFGECVSPISLFAMGVWMQNEGRKNFSMTPFPLILSMACKLFLVPLLMVGIAKVLGLNEEAGRAAVLIATLPISMASFSLASHYGIGEEMLSENVTLGTMLMLPTVLVWNIAMDALGLFPVTSSL